MNNFFKMFVNQFKPFIRNNEKLDLLKDNKNEVLLLYRHMLKNIPKMQNDLLEKKFTYQVI